MSNKVSIINTGKKHAFKDKDDLKGKIYELALDNIDEAKALYKQLIPEPADMNIIISNSEQAVNCLRVVREQSESLVKLFGEINRAEKDLGAANQQIGPGAIYDVLKQIEEQDKLKEETDKLKKELDLKAAEAKVSDDNEIKKQEDLDNLYEDNKS